MSASTMMGGETDMISTHQDDNVNNIADETHNYSYCSDHSMSSPMCITPKPTTSTRTLIDFWSNPHESGMTMSFSHYEKNSTVTSSSNSSNHKTNGSIQSLNYSPETSMGSVPLQMKMLLDVTCDDDDRNEVTEATESTTENHEDLSVLHQYSGTSNDHDDTEGITVTIPTKDEVPRQSPELTESTEPMDETNAEHFEHPTSLHIPTTVNESQDHIAAANMNLEKDVVMTSASHHPRNDTNLTMRPMTTTITGSLTKRPTPLPPLPPTARRLNRMVAGEGPASAVVITREQYIAKAIERRSKISAPPLVVVPPTDTATDLSASSVSLIPPPILAHVQSVPFVDTSLSTIHDDVDISFDRAALEEQGCPEETSQPENASWAVDVANTGPHPFSSEREMKISDDHELDLTSIHSEDSDGQAPRNTRHHVVNIEENHHGLIQDVCIPFCESIDKYDNADGDDISEYGDNFEMAQPKNTQQQLENEVSDNMLNTEDCGVVSPSMVSPGAAIYDDLVATELKENVDFVNSREHNRSNDTERMLANVIDAAEKSILKGQEEQTLLLSHQLEPSMFFDCEEYDASSQLRANDSALPLKFLTLNEPMLSPLPTINDGQIYEDTVINSYDAHTATSPMSYPSEHLFTRITPLRSNSSRVEDLSTIDKITVPPLKKRVSKKKLHPRADGADQLTERIKKEYRKRERRSSPAHMVDDVDDDELSSSVSTLEIDDEKDESTDLFWIDAFLDFVSPPEDSRSVDSDSSTSTGTGSNGAIIRNVDASTGNTISSHTEHGSSQKQFRNKKKPPTSLTRLREWWQKELIEEVMKGNLVKPLHDGETDSVDPRGSNETVEKIVSHEFHKVLHGQKVSLLGAKQSTKEQEKPTMSTNPSDWLEALKATIESAAMGSLVCGASETTVVEDEVPVHDSAIFSSPKSFDSLDDLVRELKNTKIETDPAILREHFQSMYNQLQQRFKDAQLFDQTMPAETIPLSAEQNVRNVGISGKNEKSNDGPSVEVLPDDSLELLLNSKSPMYSPPTTDYLQQPDEIISRRSGKSNARVAKALAKAKAAMAKRRRAAQRMSTGSPKGTLVSKGDSEASESLQTIPVDDDIDISVALEDLDISMDECTIPPVTDKTETEDDISITLNDPSSFVSELNTTDPCSIDRTILDLADSIKMDEKGTGPELSQDEERPEASVVSESVNEMNHQKSSYIANEVVKDKLDKRNVTKETVTDNSGSEDSINMTSELDQLIISRNQGDNASEWQEMEPQAEISSTSVSANDSHATRNSEYHPLDSSRERQWHELSTSGPSDDSTDQIILTQRVQLANNLSNSKPLRTSSVLLRSKGSRSSNLKMMTLLASEDVFVPKQRIGFKSKAFRKAQSYVAMQTGDHNSSLSTSRSTSTCSSDLPVLNGTPYNPTMVRSATSDQNTKMSKLVRNASLLSIIRKKSKKQRSDDYSSEVLKATLINSTDRGSDDDTSPQSNDIGWEEFPSNTFRTFKSSKAEI